MADMNVLVIKLGALGDFVQAFGPFAAIRAHHPGDRITLLTTAPFADLARATPWFDEIRLDERPRLWQPGKLLALRSWLRGGDFRQVYDLQTSDRSSSYFLLMGKQPRWSGIAPGCSHPHANPDRDSMHTIERQREQLVMAGIATFPTPDLSWASGDLARFGLPRPHALLCPGGAVHRPGKRWPAERFAAVATWLSGNGITPLLLGTGKEAPQLAAIAAACPAARDLSGRTSPLDIIALARQAVVAIGNDTGPMHLIAAGGCPSVVLFSHESDPSLCAPRGRVTVLRRPSLAELETAEVEAALSGIVGAS
ncbi:glycosyltransferase family 9 protein [Magnetospirillum sp. SS-4]|uniref:glycosyltransferase family 9 protein n=1 Tax=Magnetospirillum sp. SS-4 TaxID=2681465 RepID=UPI00137FF97A|nr:glycosyltransferase family 9 protein [Magnetospirillum sp. SS-4]CAA7619333.1 ADP-heptose of LPS heptosyltransferase [Magnetospirillum sp. SS-4]